MKAIHGRAMTYVPTATLQHLPKALPSLPLQARALDIIAAYRPSFPSDVRTTKDEMDGTGGDKPVEFSSWAISRLVSANDDIELFLYRDASNRGTLAYDIFLDGKRVGLLILVFYRYRLDMDGQIDAELAKTGATSNVMNDILDFLLDSEPTFAETIRIDLALDVGTSQTTPSPTPAGIPPKSTLPPDLDDWREVQVNFPRLAPDTSEKCSVEFDKLWDYVAIESGDCGEAGEERLQFIRTALIGDDVHYWIWRYTDSQGKESYLSVGTNEIGQYIMGLTGTIGLSPEQYILADYYRLITEA